MGAGVLGGSDGDDEGVARRVPQCLGVAVVPGGGDHDEQAGRQQDLLDEQGERILDQRLGERDLEYMPDLGDDAIRAVARLRGIASNGFRNGLPSSTLPS